MSALDHLSPVQFRTRSAGLADGYRPVSYHGLPGPSAAEPEEDYTDEDYYKDSSGRDLRFSSQENA